MKTVESVDLDRFMGIWYVNAHIPTSFEDRCTNAVEYYRWKNSDRPGDRPGIENAFYCQNEGTNDFVKLDGYTWVHDTKSNAEWRIEFLWPFPFAYKVIGLTPDYSETMIGHPSRDYLWIMSRTPTLSPARIEYWMKEAEKQGYSRAKLRIVPFRPGFQMSEPELRSILGRRERR